MMGRVFVLLCLCFVGVLGLRYPSPENTCPQYLRFEELYGLAVGVLEIPNDGSGNYTLRVNGSLPFQTNDHLKISLPDYHDIIRQPMPILKYHIFFASQQGYPKITSIIFNDRVLCFSTPYPVGPNGRTNVWASSKVLSSVQVGVLGTAETNIDDHIYFPQQPIPNFPQQSIPNLPVSTPNPPVSSPRPPIIPPPTKAPAPPPKPPVETPKPPPAQPVNLPAPVTQSTMVEPFTSPNNDKMCGVVLHSIPLVISDEPVEESEFPWMTALYRYSNNDRNYKFLCTSNLISDKHVITAGHCVNYEGIILYDLEDLILVFGKTNLGNWARGGTIGKVAKVTVHPDYEQGRAGHDIVIFTLTKSVKFTNTIYPLCVWDSLGTAAQEGVVAGWGRTNVNKYHHSITPYKLTMPIVSQDECENSHPVYVGLTSDYVFCAGSRNGAGPCGGDTGAGLIVKIQGRQYLKGIVSHVESKNGTDCDLSAYVLFADVANEKDWITSVINEN